MSLHEKIPTSDTLVSCRWSMHIGWVLKTQVVYVIIFCLITYLCTFYMRIILTLQIMHKTCLITSGFFFCKLVWRVCHLMKRLVQRNIFTRLEMKPKQLLYVIFPAYKCFNWEVFSVIEFYITNHRGHFKHWYLKYYKNVNTEQWLYLALLN